MSKIIYDVQWRTTRRYTYIKYNVENSVNADCFAGSSQRLTANIDIEVFMYNSLKLRLLIKETYIFYFCYFHLSFFMEEFKSPTVSHIDTWIYRKTEWDFYSHVPELATHTLQLYYFHWNKDKDGFLQ